MQSVRSLLKENQILFKYVSRISQTLHRSKARIEYNWNNIHNPAPINPLSLITIDPNRIKYRSMFQGLSPYSIKTPYSPVFGGDWHTNVEELENYDLYYSIVEHFNTGKPWDQTDFYQRVKSQFETGGLKYKWGSSNINEFKQRCEELDKLYNEIKNFGYKNQRELRTNRFDVVDDNRSTRKSLTYPAELNEITIHIGPDGEMLFWDGRNRFSIVRAIGLDEIPVRVAIRHKEWQTKRNQIATVDSKEQLPSQLQKLLDHPDVQDIKPASNTTPTY